MSNIIKTFITSIILLYSAHTLAFDSNSHPIQFEIDPNSGIKAEVIKRIAIPMVRFHGEIKLKAKYIVTYDDSRSYKLIIELIPNKSLNNIIKIKDRGEKRNINRLYVGKNPKIIKKLLGVTNYKKMYSGEIKMMSGQAEFVLSGITATYECDTLMYYSGIKKLGKILIAANTKKIAKKGC